MSLFQEESYSLKLPQADIRYFPSFFSKEKAQTLFNLLYTETSWKQDDIKVFGKVYNQPRLTALYASNNKPYSYASLKMIPEKFTKTLQEIKEEVEKTTGTSFTTCLLNLYRDGNDSNGWHSDDERELGKNPVIASVSLGGERVFKLRHRNDHSQTAKLILESGSLLLMKGTTQHYWHHQIPKTKKTVSPRINLTFRVIK